MAEETELVSWIEIVDGFSRSVEVSVVTISWVRVVGGVRREARGISVRVAIPDCRGVCGL